jgi:SAM-dependent methyltransferase
MARAAPLTARAIPAMIARFPRRGQAPPADLSPKPVVEHAMPRVDTDRFYRGSLQTHGHTAEGVQWHSEHSQRTRFKALRKLLPEDLSRYTIADAGCGLGDLYRFLEEHDDKPERYIGIDVVEPMVEAARARIGCTILLLDVLTDPMPQADYYVCSGAMNTLTRDETRTFIERCFAASTVGFIFNLLCGRDTSHSYNLCLPADVREWTSHLDAEVQIVEGYLHGDFTAMLTRTLAAIRRPVGDGGGGSPPRSA